MKITHRIPTKEYAYVEVEIPENKVIEASEIALVHKELLDAFAPQIGLSEKDFNRCVDEYMNTGTLKDGTELYNSMSDKQKYVFQVLKRHGKRNGYAERNIKPTDNGPKDEADRD